MSILERLPENEIISAVLEAGKLLDGAGAVHEIHAKNRTDFVTDVDVRVQETLKARLAELLPEVQFMGEGYGAVAQRPNQVRCTVHRVEYPERTRPVNGGVVLLLAHELLR